MRNVPAFMFATGIENSIPTIHHGRTRIDEMEACGHYEYWREDFELVDSLGLCFLRYGPPLYRTWLAPERYDWSFADLTFDELRRRDLVPLVDLCHFGVPDWVGNFQNPDFPHLFAGYARAFAERYPWVQLYTPINEMYVCAVFSARYGWWNEQLTTHTGFVTALKHMVKANVLAMQAVLEVRPDALFVQSESTEYFHAENPRAMPAADVRNAERFLSLDLNYGRPVDSVMYEYLLDGGMTQAEYRFFMEQRLKPYCIMGNDYYVTNEHRVYADGHTGPAGEVFGYDALTWQYYDRYRLPVMHTETNYVQGPQGDEAVYWLWKQWANVMHCRDVGVPIVGFTWYSLTDQIDWHIALREQTGHVNAVGLFDLERRIRPVGEAYRQLIRDWREVLPTESVCLRVPLVMPSEYDEDWAVRRRSAAAVTEPVTTSAP